jgi:hypothetical protein
MFKSRDARGSIALPPPQQQRRLSTNWIQALDAAHDPRARGGADGSFVSDPSVLDASFAQTRPKDMSTLSNVDLALLLKGYEFEEYDLEDREGLLAQMGVIMKTQEVLSKKFDGMLGHSNIDEKLLEQESKPVLDSDLVKLEERCASLSLGRQPSRRIRTPLGRIDLASPPNAG